MPIYDFQCRSCGHEFEALVRGSATPSCPSCQGADLQRLPSAVRVTSAEKLKSAVAAGRRTLAKTTWRDQRQAQLDIERDHDH